MKFYVITESSTGETVGCELTKAKAHEVGQATCRKDRYYIRMIEASVNTDTVRRLLGELGGYAISQHDVI